MSGKNLTNFVTRSIHPQMIERLNFFVERENAQYYSKLDIRLVNPISTGNLFLELVKRC